MKLHRSLSADWSKLPEDQLNFWQRPAAKTGGIVTPGNVISLVGGLLVVLGLVEIFWFSLGTGLILVMVGRTADLLDGIVADVTKTKSPIGEGVDATVDKTVLCLALITLIAKQLLPLGVGIVIAIHALYNIGLWAVAHSQKARLHPSSLGKITAAALWLCLGLYLLDDWLKPRHLVIAHRLGYWAFASFLVFTLGAIGSGYCYSRYLYYKGYSGTKA